MRGRLIRLAIVSAVALGVITLLAARTLSQASGIDMAGIGRLTVSVLLLGIGWITMPFTLLLLLRRPRLRPLLFVPSTAITMGLLAVLTVAPSLGWWLITVGILAGDVLGAWLWMELAPIPRALQNPLGPARWGLIGAHVAPILAGFAVLLAA